MRQANCLVLFGSIFLEVSISYLPRFRSAEFWEATGLTSVPARSMKLWYSIEHTRRAFLWSQLTKVKTLTSEKTRCNFFHSKPQYSKAPSKSRLSKGTCSQSVAWKSLRTRWKESRIWKTTFFRTQMGRQTGRDSSTDWNRWRLVVSNPPNILTEEHCELIIQHGAVESVLDQDSHDIDPVVHALVVGVQFFLVVLLAGISEI